MKFELITLDLDDTLWDSEPALRRAEQAVYEFLADAYPEVTARYSIGDLVTQRRALMQSRPDIGYDFTRLRHAALAQIAEQFGYPSALADMALEIFLEIRSQVEIYEDVLPVLEKLSREYRLVALSNGNADVHKVGVGHLFESAVSPGVAGASKPDPAIFDYVVQSTGVARDAILHVGDEPETDILGALRAGISAVWINRQGRAWPESYEPPPATIEAFADLPRAIGALLRVRLEPASQD